MKKNIFALVTVLFFLLIPASVLAKSGQAEQAGQANQVKNQVQTQNQGEDSQLQVNTQEDSQGSQSRSDTARLHMSSVAQAVEDLLENKDSQGGIGEQVRQIAQQQNQAQSEIANQLNKLESRQGLVKKLFGADHKAISNLNQHIQQNQQRIELLQQLQIQLTNQADQAQVQQLIQSLVSQNTALQNQVQAEEQISSLFGWLAKLFK